MSSGVGLVTDPPTLAKCPGATNPNRIPATVFTPKCTCSSAVIQREADMPQRAGVALAFAFGIEKYAAINLPRTSNKSWLGCFASLFQNVGLTHEKTLSIFT